MTLEQLRQEWESIALKFEEPNKEFRKFEKEYYQKFLEVLKNETGKNNGKNLWLPEFQARNDLDLLDLADKEKQAYDTGYRGKSFYWQNK